MKINFSAKLWGQEQYHDKHIIHFEVSSTSYFLFGLCATEGLSL